MGRGKGKSGDFVGRRNPLVVYIYIDDADSQIIRRRDATRQREKEKGEGRKANANQMETKWKPINY